MLFERKLYSNKWNVNPRVGRGGVEGTRGGRKDGWECGWEIGNTHGDGERGRERVTE